MDHKSGEMIAIKIIRNKSRFHKQGMIEIKILDELRKKDREKKLNIIHMIDHFNFRNHLCISFELLGLVWIKLYDIAFENSKAYDKESDRSFLTSIEANAFFRMNLYELIKKHNFQGFSLSVVRRIAIAILRCLRALYDEKIIHCDLKPVNFDGDWVKNNCLFRKIYWSIQRAKKARTGSRSLTLAPAVMSTRGVSDSKND